MFLWPVPNLAFPLASPAPIRVKVVPEGCFRHFFGVKVKTVKLICGEGGGCGISGKGGISRILDNTLIQEEN